MKVQLQPGKYVVAVSGGVDSVSLLHALLDLPGVELIVAHFDHGIRPDSAEDRKFVASLTRRYGLVFEAEKGKLGTKASEAAAREARYSFLRRVQVKHNAKAIITAHHQDDVLETAIINLLRGTGRKGLSSLIDKKDVRRPLLHVSKAEIVEYAEQNHLEWREDSTNSEEKYLRNRVRLRIMPKLDESRRLQLLELIKRSTENNLAIDTLLVKYLSKQIGAHNVNRQSIVSLPHEVAREMMAAWLRNNGIRDFDRRTLERLVVGAKTARPGSQLDVRHSINLRVGKDNLALVGVER